MSTVQSLYNLIQYRRDINVSTDDLIHIVNAAVRTIAKRLYWHGSDLLREEMSVSIFAEDTYTASTIAFVDSNPDTITDSAEQFVIEGFEADMPITTNSTSNAGPFRINTAAAKTLTLVSTDSVTAALAGTSVTITSDDGYGYLPTGFWGLVDQPYLDGKTYPLLPLPSLDIKLSYVSPGEPRYYQLKGSKIYVTPDTSSDYTIKGDYFARPTELTATTDTLPFYELFDDAMAEYIMRYFRGGQEGAAAIPDLSRILIENVDMIAANYDRKAPVSMPTGIPWNSLTQTSVDW
jgi:hypothetical protein